MKLSKVFSVVMVAVMFLATVSNVVLAYNPNQITSDTTGDAANKVQAFGENILGIVQIVGTIAAIITLIILGIKYMMGSAEEKAEYKKTLMPYVIGAVLVLAASNIVAWVFSAAGGFFE